MPPRLSIPFVIGIAIALPPSMLRADTLVATNGETFIGNVVSQTNDAVIFQSELAGQLTFPRSKIRQLQITTPAPTPSTSVAAASNPPAIAAYQSRTNLLKWMPPDVGHGKDDWVQLKSGEWLRGQFKYLQSKKLEFDSDELEQQTIKLKNIWQAYPAAPMWVKFDSLDNPIFGKVVLSNQTVTVTGNEIVSLPSDDLIGITPPGLRGINDWSGHVTLGLSLQSGNNNLTTFSAMGELARRTPNTDWVTGLLGNFGSANGQQTANNLRVDSNYDIRLNRQWFVRPGLVEYYRDPLANIDTQWTFNPGAGYYFFDRDDLIWNVSAGPAYQYTRFSTVEPGRSNIATAPAGILSSYFKVDITRRLDLTLNFQGRYTSEESGRYVQHSVAILSYEIKRYLDLDASYIWDYTKNPQQKSDGSIPLKSDSFLTVGLGVRF